MKILLEDHDSPEEWWFSLWCEQANEEGYIERWGHHPNPLTLAERASIPVTKHLKTKTKVVDKFLLHPAEYTADHVIKTTMGWGDVFGWQVSQDGHYWFDVKGSFSLHNDAKYFSLVRKWVWDKHGIFVNKMQPEKFFAKTWVPEEIRNGKRGKPLKKWSQCKTIQEFENDR